MLKSLINMPLLSQILKFKNLNLNSLKLF
jgi:hypothetical protein